MNHLFSLAGSPVAAGKLRTFLSLWAGSALALFGATWVLWTPQQVFPQVPLLAWGLSVPRWGEAAALGVVIAALIGVFLLATFAWEWPPRAKLLTAALVSFTAALGVLIICDQHRLQPWAYQFGIVAFLLAALPPARAFVLLRWLVISIYIFSAISKFDATFLHTLGQQFFEALLSFAGASGEALPPSVRWWGALAFPLAELLLGLALCLPLANWPWPRRFVIGAIVAMHLGLLLILGPLGLDHRWGVLLWNLWFIPQVILLFGFPTAAEAAENLRSAAPPLGLWAELREVVVEFVAVALLLLPVFEFFDRFDHWPAWGLYAPRASRATLLIKEPLAKNLPLPLQAFLQPVDGAANWRQVRLDRWSLAKLGAPIYPQDRFQLAAAQAVLQRYRLGDGFQVILEGPADRFDGTRKQQVFQELPELSAIGRRFWLGGTPRNNLADEALE